ncbi:MAG: serine--tRNA ligase [Gammaproteobacteria bacterium]
MLDPQRLRSDPEAVAAALRPRGYELDTGTYAQLEEARKRWQVATQDLQHERNSKSKLIGMLKARREDASTVLEEVANLGERLTAAEEALQKVQAQLEAFSLLIPNIPHASVPTGQSEADNIEIRRWGTAPDLGFPARDHVDIGGALGHMDFDAAAKIAGARFVVLSGPLARLHRALTQFMLDLHTQSHGYTEVYVPYLVNAGSMLGTGQLPKFAEDLFAVPGQGFYLIPTAEVPVTNLARDSIIEAEGLPRRTVCHTPCFRCEAGSYGKDTRGMIRQHQFDKVELVQLVRPQDSYAALEELTGHAERVLQLLGLHYRVMALCSADLGFSAAKTYDLEVWLPGQQCFREISSCSNFEAFQARRMKARWRPELGRPEPLHTLNGSGLAVGRTLIAVMENYQDANGRIRIPERLQSYLGGMTEIE